MSKLKVIVCRVGQPPVIEEIDPGLKPMQNLVGGYIEAVRLEGEYGGPGIDLYCDEEFLLKSYQPNRLIRNDLAIHGTFFIAAHNEEGDTLGLTDAQLIKWMSTVKSWPVALNF
jgi:hypothetical protein